jgi:ribosomal protein L7/L12
VSDRKQYIVTLGERQRSSKIEAIKSYRRVFDLGLVEAKDAIDAMLPSGKSLLLTEEQAARLTHEGFKVFGKTTRSIQVYVREEDMDGRKIEAIKRLRNAIGWGLKETKDVMDEMWFTKKPVDIGMVNEYTVVQLRNAGFTVTGWIDNHFDGDLFEI